MFAGHCNGRKGPWRGVPSIQKAVSPSDSKAVMRTKGRKKFWRNEVLRRAGIPGDERKDLRICGRHAYVDLRDSFCYSTPDGSKKTETATFLVPEATRKKVVEENESLPSSKGLGSERFQASVLESLQESSWEANSQRVQEVVESVIHSVTKEDVLSQLSNEDDPGNRRRIIDESVREDLRAINARVRQQIGLDGYLETAGAEGGGGSIREKKKVATSRSETVLPPPKVSMSMSNKEVKLRTGFSSQFHLLSFVAAACNGDVKEMARKETQLTWLEEWWVYFEWIWGRKQMFKSKTGTLKFVTIGSHGYSYQYSIVSHHC
jgi:hypothetical protein